MLIQKMVNLLKDHSVVIDLFPTLLDNLIVCFQNNHKNLICLETFSFLGISIGKSSDQNKQICQEKADMVSTVVFQIDQQSGGNF